MVALQGRGEGNKLLDSDGPGRDVSVHPAEVMQGVVDVFLEGNAAVAVMAEGVLHEIKHGS